MLTPPGDLPENALAEALAAGWGMRVTALNYLPVGWGSHHWDAVDRDGSRWFITVDELENKRVRADESLDDGFARLRASLRSAAALRKAGCEFVIAPVAANDAEHVLRFGARFAVAVYRFTEGRTFRWGEWTAEERSGTLRMVTPLPELIELYRMGWDVKDMAYDAARFFRPHAESADDSKTWDGLTSLVRRMDELMELLSPWHISSLGTECPESGGCSPTGRRQRSR